MKTADGKQVWVSTDGAAAVLGDLGVAPIVAPIVKVGGSIGGSIAAGAIGGSWGGPIGAGIGIIAGLISSIFGAHAAKVQREDEISGAWAASGPKAIDAVMAAYKSGQISASDAKAGLDQIQSQFYSMTQPITKFGGKFGAFPDPNGPRPPNNCNWACGTSWDLNQQILKLKSDIDSSPVAGFGSIGNIFGGLDTVTLIAIAVGAYLVLG